MDPTESKTASAYSTWLKLETVGLSMEELSERFPKDVRIKEVATAIEDLAERCHGRYLDALVAALDSSDPQ